MDLIVKEWWLVAANTGGVIVQPREGAIGVNVQEVWLLRVVNGHNHTIQGDEKMIHNCQ